MFKFNFNIENEESHKEGIGETKKILENGEQELEWYESKEIIPDEKKHFSNIGLFKLNSTCLNIGDFKLYSVQYEKQIKCLQNSVNGIKSADSNHSDLIPAVYEGGAKIWECTEDLLNYLETSNSKEHLNKKIVLDLGCGAGILGIFAKLNGAIVHFQDYNTDVLETITIPNYLINLPSTISNYENLEEKFYSGDWFKYSELTKKSIKFDLILTAETIYNPNNQNKLLNTFADKLKPDGVILLAAKTYYFGVGGGLRQFENLILEDKRFQSKIVWKSNIGVCREILEIKFIN